MKVVRFLEREDVIRFFGAALLLAPFVSIGSSLLLLKTQNQLSWAQVSVLGFLLSGNPISYFLAVCNITIGAKMLGGSTKAWRYVLFLIGAHLLLQILDVKKNAWQGPLAWPTFIFNAGLLFFIIDQLVWKIKVAAPVKAEEVKKVSEFKEANSPVVLFKEKQTVNLKSYRKILFSFGSTKPWGELKTLSSEELSVKSFSLVPKNVENQIIQINFAKDVVVDIQFSRKENEMYYFTPLNMQKDDIVRLNTWLKKIAV